jgi:hypothetical protein
MSDTPELDDLIAVANAAIAVGQALQRTRDELNQSPSRVDEAGAAGCRDLIIYLAADIRAASKTPIEIVRDRLPQGVVIVICKKT